ncbi:MAG TPA: hypothetical protein VF972_01940 [Actinomycetota bacterium]
MRIGELLDTAIRLYRSQWKAFMGIVAVVLVPFLVIQGYLTRTQVANPFSPSPQATTPPSPALLILFNLLFFFFVQPPLAGAVARAAVQVYRGERPDVAATYRFALGKVRTILWVTILTALSVLLGFVLLIIPGFIALVRLTFITVVVVVESERGRGALRRSWRLAKGHFWKIFGTLILAGILTAVVAGILQIPLTLAAIPLGTNAWILRTVGVVAAGVVVRPFSALIVVLLYFDMRVRKEGLDLALMAHELGLTT